jgi:hypothetical protein
VGSASSGYFVILPFQDSVCLKELKPFWTAFGKDKAKPIQSPGIAAKDHKEAVHFPNL